MTRRLFRLAGMDSTKHKSWQLCFKSEEPEELKQRRGEMILQLNM